MEYNSNPWEELRHITQVMQNKLHLVSLQEQVNKMEWCIILYLYVVEMWLLNREIQVPQDISC